MGSSEGLGEPRLTHSRRGGRSESIDRPRQASGSHHSTLKQQMDMRIIGDERRRLETRETRPVGWSGWDDAVADRIRDRIREGDYASRDVLDVVARRLLATGAV